jgi:hypothetical protein
MKNTINKEEVTGVLQSSITSVSCMFPSIFTKDDVIRLLNEIQGKIEELPSMDTEQVVAPTSSSNNEKFIFDISKKDNVETLCQTIIEAVDEYVMNLDFSDLSLDVDFDHSYYDNEFTVTANFDKSSLSDSVYSEFRFDMLKEDLRSSITSLVEEESEKAALNDSLTSEN